MNTDEMIRLFLFLILTVFGATAGYSQQKFHGKIYESDAHVTIGGVVITNLRTKISTVSDSTGKFSIPAAISDLITFKSFVFRTDTVLVVDFREHQVYLTPLVSSLSEVLIAGQKKVKLGSLIDPEYHGQTVVYQRNDDGSLRGGLTFRISYWNKDNKTVRRSIKRMKDQEIYGEIDKVFNSFTIQKFLPLKGSELNDFVGLYRPSIAVFKSKNFDLFLYLNDSYKKFIALPSDQRKLPSLKVTE